MRDKLCPLLSTSGRTYKCFGKECGWWCEFAEDCAVPLVAGILADSSICQNAWDDVRFDDER
jgi:hypothetical protein